MPARRRYASLEERILANTVCMYGSEFYWNGSYCWLWLGKFVESQHAGRKKYGVLTMRAKRGPAKGKPRNLRVARVVLEVFKGRVMRARDVAKHLCPHTSLCCNPEHLQGGSQRANVRQSVREGTHFSPWRKAA